jgi:hypothetical protein
MPESVLPEEPGDPTSLPPQLKSGKVDKSIKPVIKTLPFIFHSFSS